MHAFALIQVDQPACAVHGGFGVKAQTRIHFGRHPARYMVQDFDAETHQQPVHDFIDAEGAKALHRFPQQGRVFGFLHRLEDQ